MRRVLAASDDPTSEVDTPDAHGDLGSLPCDEIVVILSAREFNLPDVLRNLEAGRIVLVIPPLRAK